MSLLDFDGDEEFDRLLARIQRRELIRKVTITLLVGLAAIGGVLAQQVYG